MRFAHAPRLMRRSGLSWLAVAACGRRPLVPGSWLAAGWVARVSGDVENSQAVRDAERADADLVRALRAGATLTDVAELTAAKAKADERVAVLRRRVEPLQGSSRQAAVEMLERRQRRREARAEMDAQNRPT